MRTEKTQPTPMEKAAMFTPNDQAPLTTDSSANAATENAARIAVDCWGPKSEPVNSSNDRGQTGGLGDAKTLNMPSLWSVGPDDKVNVVDTSKYDTKGDGNQRSKEGSTPAPIIETNNTNHSQRPDQQNGSACVGEFPAIKPGSTKHDRTDVEKPADRDVNSSDMNTGRAALGQTRDTSKHNSFGPGQGRSELPSSTTPGADRHDVPPVRNINSPVKEPLRTDLGPKRDVSDRDVNRAPGQLKTDLGPARDTSKHNSFGPGQGRSELPSSTTPGADRHDVPPVRYINSPVGEPLRADLGPTRDASDRSFYGAADQGRTNLGPQRDTSNRNSFFPGQGRTELPKTTTPGADRHDVPPVRYSDNVRKH